MIVPEGLIPPIPVILAQAAAVPLSYFNETADVIKALVLIAGVMASILTVALTFRKEREKSAVRSKEIGDEGASASIVAVGGAIAARSDMVIYIDALRDQTAALKFQAENQEKLAKANLTLAETSLDRTRAFREGIDEIRALRMAIQEILHVQRQWRGHSGSEEG